MTEILIEKKPELVIGMAKLCGSEDEIFFASLATEDGFPIYSVGVGYEEDKFAAINSTITALSNSCSKEVLKEEFLVTTIEGSSGNILFVKTNYLDLSCVLMVASKTNKTTLAKCRYKTINMAKEISSIR